MGASASRPGPAGFDPSRIRKLLNELVSGGDHSCLNGTPMIPLHKETVRMLAEMIDAPRFPPICGYPLKGWQLGYVQFDTPKDGQPNGWIVKLQRETPNWQEHRLETNVMARSDLGPLEAWEEAIRMAQRCDERHAIAMEAAKPSRRETGSTEGDSAGPKDIAQTPPESHP